MLVLHVGFYGLPFLEADEADSKDCQDPESYHKASNDEHTVPAEIVVIAKVGLEPILDGDWVRGPSPEPGQLLLLIPKLVDGQGIDDLERTDTSACQAQHQYIRCIGGKLSAGWPMPNSTPISPKHFLTSSR